MYTGHFQQIKQEPMEINKMEHRESKFWNSESRMDCLARINPSSRKESNENSFRRYSKSSEYPTSNKRTEFNQERYNKGSGYNNNNKALHFFNMNLLKSGSSANINA
ncbi:hypothetical protein BpHYR1_041056 [Brachionus plicatilis]|uniref:Uncharacterized protein n=1 Tax=Brachionus plicatilis TaxID=10195 RepID=A0A3M7P329_BRAPC|nr:hypothetical protein BpHYR1_041056 [Brachionus plicatilis]